VGTEDASERIAAGPPVFPLEILKRASHR